MIIEFFVPGEPVGKGRPRFSRKNGVAFTPAKTRSYEGIVRQFAVHKMNGVPPMDGPLRLWLGIVVAVPSSWPDWKKQFALSDRVAPTSRPDSDNVEKAIKDALNLVCWKDDCQIVESHVTKIYGEMPGVSIRVHSVEGCYPCQITKRPTNG